MIYQHTLMFHLMTPPEKITKALDQIAGLCTSPPHGLFMEKRKVRIRGLGLQRVKVVSYEVSASPDDFEDMVEQVWDANPDIISGLSVPFPN